MENLNPTWLVTTSVIYHLQAGLSVRRALFEAVRGLESDFEKFLFHWLHVLDTAHPAPSSGHRLTPHQHSLFEVLKEGMNGRPILDSLQQLEEDVRGSYTRELEEHIAKLPFLGLLPLLLFIGPAFLLLLIGPLLTQLLQELSK